MSYIALLGGREIEAHPMNDRSMVELYWRDGAAPFDGFEEVLPGLSRRVVREDELDALYKVELYCEYRGEPFKVQRDRGDELLLYYLGGDINKARELGLSIPEPLVAVGTFPRGEVENLREVRKQIWPPVSEN
jgi:hypothetical protein